MQHPGKKAMDKSRRLEPTERVSTDAAVFFLEMESWLGWPECECPSGGATDWPPGQVIRYVHSLIVPNSGMTSDGFFEMLTMQSCACADYYPESLMHSVHTHEAWIIDLVP